jgi:TolA-binding protein
MSSNVIIANNLPAEIIALEHATLDKALALCERAHAIIIPSPSIDEAGCRSAMAEANRLYDEINGLSKQLDGARLERGREITALKTKVDDAVKAAVVPLEDQRSKLGTKIATADRALRQQVAERQRKLEEERRQREQQAEAERRDAEEKARKAREEVERMAQAGVDAPPDLAAAAAAPAPPIPVRDAEPAPYVAPAPRSSVRVTKTYALEIVDLAQVPREAGGVPLWKFDEAQALKLMKAGVKIAGLRLVESETVGAKGRGGAFAI